MGVRPHRNPEGTETDSRLVDVMAGTHTVGTVLLGLLLMALGILIISDVTGLVSRYSRWYSDRFFPAPLWLLRSVGLLGIVGGVLVLIYGNSP